MSARAQSLLTWPPPPTQYYTFSPKDKTSKLRLTTCKTNFFLPLSDKNTTTSAAPLIVLYHISLSAAQKKKKKPTSVWCKLSLMHGQCRAGVWREVTGAGRPVSERGRIQFPLVSVSGELQSKMNSVPLPVMKKSRACSNIYFYMFLSRNDEEIWSWQKLYQLKARTRITYS